MNLLFIPLTIGLPAIDESLEKLLTAMETFPNVAVLGDAVSMAKALGLCLALCVGSYECWMMMLGRRGMDVMKLLRIIGISLCISSSSWICSALQVPGKSLESATWAMAKAGSGKESRVRYMGYGKGKEQGSGSLRAEGGTETE